jgi:hypothetical protein
VSDHLAKELQDLFRDYLPDQEEFGNCFDRFEYLLGLVHADLKRREWKDGWWGPLGRFIWRGRHFGVNIAEQIENEIETTGANWPPLKAGFFGGSLDQVKTAKNKFDKHLSQVSYF